MIGSCSVIGFGHFVLEKKKTKIYVFSRFVLKSGRNNFTNDEHFSIDPSSSGHVSNWLQVESNQNPTLPNLNDEKPLTRRKCTKARIAKSLFIALSSMAAGVFDFEKKIFRLGNLPKTAFTQTEEGLRALKRPFRFKNGLK